MQILTFILAGILLAGCKKPMSAKEKTVVGTYNLVGAPGNKIDIQAGGDAYFDNGKSREPTNWSVENGQVVLHDSDGYKAFMQIEANGDLTMVAEKENGVKKSLPPADQSTWKKSN